MKFAFGVVSTMLCFATAVGQLTAQQPSVVSHHHDDVAPDYETLILPRAEIVPLPPLPTPPAHVVAYHHNERMPNYLAAVAPDQPATIPIPAPPPGEPPAVVRGVYLNAWVFGSNRFYDLVGLADSTEINAFVIDVKDATGFLTYRSSIPTVMYIGANGLVRAPDARRRLALLRSRGIHPIARIVVARDGLLARRRPEWAILDANGGLWRDGLGKPWVDAYHDSVWVYAADIAAEAVLMGFREIQFDYVRWPDEPPERMARAVYAAKRKGDTQRAALRRQLTMLKNRVGTLDVPFTIDVFGLTTSAVGGMGIGQYWEDISLLADVVLPMVYPSHYPRGSYGIPYPNAEPYTVVRRALEDGLRRSNRSPQAATIRPYLQAFTLRRPRYTAEHVRAQIQAVEDVGLTDWILWNARGVYPVAALRPAPVAAPTAPAGTTDGGNGSKRDRW